MKHLYKRCTACLIIACLLWNQTGIAQGPTHTPRTVHINNNCGGYYEYLPQGYNAAGTQLYPLIVYMHGEGDQGYGTATDLTKLLNNALPKLIHDGLFPTAVTVNGQAFRFIVISPQFWSRAWPEEIASVITYAKNNYKVDTNRIYLTGMSRGGGVTWEFAGSTEALAKKLAAIVPVCGASTPTNTVAQRIASYNVPVWATHNQEDPNIPVTFTNDYVSYINNPTPPNPAARKTIFTTAPPENKHDAWTRTYDPAFKEDGKNIYEWMLTYTRAEGSLPVELVNYRILSVSKEAVVIGWGTTYEQQNSHFSVERSSDGSNFKKIGQVAATNKSTGSTYSFSDGQPLAGNNYYRLSQTDIDGKTTYYPILKSTINVPAGSLLLFPNPANGAVTLGYQHPGKDRLTVKIINQQGIVLQVTQYDKGAGYWQQTIPTGHLAAGQYYIQIAGTGFERTQSLLISH